METVEKRRVVHLGEDQLATLMRDGCVAHIVGRDFASKGDKLNVFNGSAQPLEVTVASKQHFFGNALVVLVSHQVQSSGTITTGQVKTLAELFGEDYAKKWPSVLRIIAECQHRPIADRLAQVKLVVV